MKNKSVQPTHIHILDEEIADLHSRLRNTRWAPPIASSNWEDGTDGEYLRDLISYWSNHYKWRQREERLNTFNHFVATIDTIQIHFIWAKGKSAHSIPLLLMHG